MDGPGGGAADGRRPEVLLRLGDEEAAFQVEDLFDGFAMYVALAGASRDVEDFVQVFVDPDGLQVALAREHHTACAEVMRTGVPCRFRHASQVEPPQWVETMAVRSGQYLALIHTDISDAVAAEVDLRESVTEFRSLAHTLPDIVVRFDADLRVRFANRPAARSFLVFGVPDAIGRPVGEVTPDPQFAPYVQRLHQVAQTGLPARFDMSIGDRLWETRLVPELDAEGLLRSILSLGRDATGQRAAEREREQTLRRLRTQASLLDRATDAINVRDLDGRVTYWNPAAVELYGWTADEAIGAHIDDLVNAGVRNCRPDIAHALLRDLEWQGRVAQFGKSGKPVLVELRLTVVEGMADSPDDDDHVLAIASDVTERVALEERLVQAQKLESVGQLTGGVAHDFNNLLTVILGGTEVIEQAVRNDPQLGPIAAMVQSAGQKGAELTNRLLAFSRRQPLEPRTVGVGDTIRSMSDLLRRTIGELVDIELRLDAALWPISIDPGQFEAALMNLCINARDAMPDGGVLTIEARNQPAAIADTTAGSAAAGHVAVIVTDTGHGMSRQVLEHAFDPFFTTKDVGKGSGLGLSMVHGFVNQSGGQVTIESEPGAGTTVRVLLPAQLEPTVVDDRDGPEAHDRADEQARGRGETVLLVEDDIDVRAYASGVLRELGYHVIEAADGHVALAVLRGDDAIDLLFTDVVMPGRLTGWQVAQAARQLRPTLPVLYTSGYSDHAVGEADRPSGALLHKPYRRRDLARHLRTALGG